MKKELTEVYMKDLLERLKKGKISLYTSKDIEKTDIQNGEEMEKRIKKSILWLNEINYISKQLTKKGIKISYDKDFDWKTSLFIRYNAEKGGLKIMMILGKEPMKEIERLLCIGNPEEITLKDLLEYEKKILEQQKEALKKLQCDKVLIRKEFKELLGL